MTLVAATWVGAQNNPIQLETPYILRATIKSDTVLGATCESNYQQRSKDQKYLSQSEFRETSKLIEWIISSTGWRVKEPLPLISVLPHAELVERFTGGSSLDICIRALYSRRDRIVFLPEGWRFNDLRDRAALFHELVHHLQLLNAVKAKCLAAYETQAHQLTLAWLREQGVRDPYKFLDINEFTIRLNSQCME